METLITLLPAPIPVQTTRYLCPFCRRGRSTSTATKKHMQRCWKNPALHGCKTCVLFDSNGWGAEKPSQGAAGGPGRCKAGFRINKLGPVTNCSKWTPL